MLIKGRRSNREINMSMAITNQSFNKQKRVLCSNIDLGSRKKLIICYCMDNNPYNSTWSLLYMYYYMDMKQGLWEMREQQDWGYGNVENWKGERDGHN